MRVLELRAGRPAQSDPFYLASEGRAVGAVAADQASQLLAAWRALPQGEDAAIIGEIEPAASRGVVLQTALGGEKILEELEDNPLPRIC